MKIFWLILVLVGYLSLPQVEAKTPNPYKVLGISQSASDDDIKKAFKKRSLKYHPDRNTNDPSAKDKYAKVVNAYELLKDPNRRKMYDMTGDDNPQGQQFNQGSRFGFPDGMGINIEDLLGQMGGGQRQGRQAGGGGQRYTFSFGGGEGFRFEF